MIGEEKMQKISNETIFTSVGELGGSERQDRRWYVNGQKFIEEVSDLDEMMASAINDAKNLDEPATRTVVRAHMNGQSARSVLQQSSPYAQYIETAVQIRGFRQPTWLIGIGINDTSRSISPEQKTAIKNTVDDTRIKDDLIQPQNTVYEDTDTVEPDLQEQLYVAWGQTFGWQREDIDGLQRGLVSGNEGLWFQACIDKTRRQLASAAMAEQLYLPGPDGSSLRLVESTEWFTAQAYRGYGLATHVLRRLNQRVAADCANSSIPTFLFAECNYSSRSDIAARRAGFIVPDRTAAPQILVNNVTVTNNGEQALRNFTLAQLPQDIDGRPIV
jgi:hypothetical protein